MSTTRRKVVQHGPSTLTVSLPMNWVKAHNVKKGDELHVQEQEEGLLVSTETVVTQESATVNVRGLPHIIPKTVGALYKAGYDEIILLYDGTDELEKVHEIVGTGYIGFEIAEETADRVVIRKVSQPDEKEFATLFRRIFHFLHSIADEGLEAARKNDLPTYKKMILREKNVDKLSDFCRRVVVQQGRQPAKYHVVEQLEKLGDLYRELNSLLLEEHTQVSDETLRRYEQSNAILHAFSELFFSFTLKKADAYRKQCVEFFENEHISEREGSIVFIIEHITRELYDLLGVTIMLNL